MPWAGVERDCAPEERDGGVAFSSASTFDIGQARGVVNADVHETPNAFWSAASASATVGVLAVSLAADAMADTADDAKLLDIHVQQLAGVAALVAAGWLRRFEPAELAESDTQKTAETVESAIPKQNAISAAVIRTGATARSPRRAPPRSDAESTTVLRNDRAALAGPRSSVRLV